MTLLPCPHCGRARLIVKDGAVTCPTPDCGKWKTRKDFYESGFRAYYRAFTEALKQPKTYVNLDVADELLHQAMRYKRESERL